MSADETTTKLWKEQTKINTLGYMRVAMTHYENIVRDRTENIGEIQKETLETINEPSLSELQTKALRGTYEQLLKSATEEARKVRPERAQTSEQKLRGKGPQTKRPRTDSDWYIKHTHTVDTDKNHCLYETAPLIANQRGDNIGNHPPDGHHAKGTQIHPEETKKHKRRKPDSRNRLRRLTKKRNDVCHKHDNIVNLSSYCLTNTESDILSKGLSFIPYNPHTNKVTDNDITDFVRYRYRNIQPNENPFKLKSRDTCAQWTSQTCTLI